LENGIYVVFGLLYATLKSLSHYPERNPWYILT